MPLSRTEKIVIAGAGLVGAGLLGAALALNATRPIAKTKTAPSAIITSSPNLIPPYINSGAIVVKTIGSDVGPSASFSTQPGTTTPAVEYVCDNPFGSPTQAYAYVTIPFNFGSAKVILSQIGTYMNNDGGWLSVSGRLNIWDQTGVNDFNWFTGGGTGFITGIDVPASLNKNALDSATLSIDVSSKTALTAEAAFSGGDIPFITAHAWMAPITLILQVTPIITITINVTTTGSIPLTGIACTLFSTTTGLIVATGLTGSDGAVAFHNVLADNFQLNATSGSVTHTATFTATVNTVVPVTFPAPNPAFSLSTATPSIGQSVTFDPSLSTEPDPGAVPTQQVWLWGDGTSLVLYPSNPDFLRPITHTYTSPGIFWPILALTDTADRTGVTTRQITVGPPPVTVSVTVEDSAGVTYPGQRVTLRNSSGTFSATVLTNGAGIAVFASVPVDTYVASATLALGGAPGFTENTLGFLVNGPANVTIVFSRPVPLIDVLTPPPFLVSLSSADPGQSLIISADASGNGTPGVFLWTAVSFDFGDGSPVATGTNTSSADAGHVYATGPATYTIKVSLTNVAGLTGVGFRDFPVNPPSSAVISANPNPVFVDNGVQFNSTVVGGLAPYAYLWNFGDGTTSTLTDPIHTWTIAGVYTVSLTITDALGLKTIATLTVTVESPLAGGGGGGGHAKPT